MFSKGQILFTVVFALVFVGYLIWSYWKDKQHSRVHYKKSWLVLVGLLTFIGILYLIVKMR
ncbi:MAG: CcoQ/FixQ family Cbb3-type cytochrome c oxidase assembly chaperone, partial [Bacteroidia bacterium]|nr:CcoQ/FixQ family Cbb3-type cytochrome c oxidase assembly chaperone [Bacteroidia bacterium]